MPLRLNSFARALRSSRLRVPLGRPGRQLQLTRFVCQSCRLEFSSSLVSRRITIAPRRSVATSAKNAKEKRYPAELLIYDAGDTRTAFVSFWKAMALLQFGTCVVFLTPVLYQNENQPNKNMRVLQAVGVGLLSTIPSAVLSFLTAPYVRQVYLQVPLSARHSLNALRAFARNIPPATKLTFQTLRIFPFRKSTSCFLHELRALPPRKLRFANIELPKTEAWRKRHMEKGWWRRFVEFVREPRFKFYVKEGKAYTIRTGVPGVWEEVARKIQEQTSKDGARTLRGGLIKSPTSIRSDRLVNNTRKPKPVKRQTSRQGIK